MNCWRTRCRAVFTQNRFLALVLSNLNRSG